MPQNINSIVMTGNLTRDPELRGNSGQVCAMRIASNTRAKNGDAWEDKANYFDVVCFGKQAENCQKYLSKGSSIAISGRLEWREWTAQDGSKRQANEIVAETVQFIGGGQEDRGGSSSGGSSQSAPAAAVAPATADPDDDIPF